MFFKQNTSQKIISDAKIPKIEVMKIVEIFEKLLELGADVRLKEPLANHTSMKLGGPVDYLVFPNDQESFVESIGFLNECDIPWRIMGFGTNLIVEDGEHPGAVLKTERLTSIHFKGSEVVAECGISLKRLCRLCALEGLSGLEFAYGIPGSLGGAIYMNAGAYGGEIGEVVKEVLVFDGKESRWISGVELSFGYRESLLKKEKLIALKAVLKLKRDDPQKVQGRMIDFLRRRIEKQPLDLPSAGSIFKRPRKDFYVGKAIESLGLKGYRVGGAEISRKHAGFIVNIGGAKFEDILKLIDLVKREVKRNYDVVLETEVEIWRSSKR